MFGSKHGTEEGRPDSNSRECLLSLELSVTGNRVVDIPKNSDLEMRTHSLSVLSDGLQTFNEADTLLYVLETQSYHLANS